MRHICSIALAGVTLLCAPAQAQAPKPKTECFFVNQFENWKAGGDDKTINIRVTGNRYYKLDLANHCTELTWPMAMMVNNFRSPSICSPLDWDIRISQGQGSIASPCMVKAMTRLSPAEVAAMPKKQKP